MRSNAVVWSFTILVTLGVVAPIDLLAQTPGENTQARVLFVAGRDLWDEGKFVESEKKFREALVKFPKAEQSDRTAFFLITTLIKLGRTADARVEIENFNRNYPQSSWRSDVEEKRLSLNGLPVFFPAQGNLIRRPAGLRIVGRGVPVGPINVEPVTEDAWNGGVSVINASLGQEVLRLIIQKDSERGIEEAKKRLKVNPSDPVVVTNLGTIANSGSAQAVPFLVTLTVDASVTPNTRNQALFWMNRVDKEAVAKALSEMLKVKESVPAVAETLSRFNVAERRSALDQIVKVEGPEKMATLDKLYKGTTNVTFRSQIIQFVAPIPDAAALTFLDDVARNEREALPLRSAAVRAMGERKDVETKALVEIMNSLPPSPAKPAR